MILRHLADNNVSVNVASGFYHDHLFVQEGEEELVMDLLRQLSQSVTESTEEVSGAGKNGGWIDYETALGKVDKT